MKIEIGSKYEGPPLDRPCLRQLPRGWVLEESREPWWLWCLRFVVRLLRG